MSQSPASGSASIRIVFFTVFLDLLGFGLIIPVQPFLAQTYGASPTVITWLGMLYSLVQFLFSPIWGRLSDRVGRRPVLILTILITALGHLWFGLSGSLLSLFLSRAVAGLGAGNLGTAQAIVADLTTPETRAKGMGVLGAAFGLGFILGPAAGGILSQVSLTTSALVAAGMSLINAISALIFLKETWNPRQQPSELYARPKVSLAQLKESLKKPKLPFLLLIYFVFSVGFSIMEQDIPLFISKSWSEDLFQTDSDRARDAAAKTAWMLIAVGVTATLVQGVLIGPLTKRFGEKRVLSVGLLLVAAGLALVPLTALGSYPFIFVSAVIIAAGSGMTNPSMSSLVSRASKLNEQGGTLGLAQSLSALGRVVGPGIAGFLFSQGPALPFWSGALFMLICLWLSTKVKEVHPSQN